MRKYRIKQVSENEFIPQTKSKYQLFWRHIWWIDCESLSIFFPSKMFHFSQAEEVIRRFKEKENIEKKFPIIHKL